MEENVEELRRKRDEVVEKKKEVKGRSLRSEETRRERKLKARVNVLERSGKAEKRSRR